MTETTHHTLVTLKENRFALIALLLAFLLTGWMAWLNYSMHQSASLQLLRAQQLQERAQSHVQDQYTEYLKQEAANRRFEKAFEIKQQHYTLFMGGVSDVWLAVNRHDKTLLDDALHRMRKSFYGLEPFLDGGGRHYLKKHLQHFEALAQQLYAGDYDYKQNEAAHKVKLNEMSDTFQDYLYPLLFEPEQTPQENTDEAAQTGE